VKISFLCPHLRIAGGVRAILGYADRLAGRGHDVSVIVPARRARAWWRPRLPRVPDWMPDLRARIAWAPEWRAAELPDGDVVIATAWQSAQPVADAPSRCGRKFYLIQHYESLYHGEAARVDDTYRLPLEKIAISTWLADIMGERFQSVATVIVTPVDPTLFHPESGAEDDERRVLMLHHEYAWKGVADGIEAVSAVRKRHPDLRLVGFGVKPPAAGLPYDEFFTDLAQSRLAWLYTRCPIYLCPSWDEGLGMPAMEAMACGAALCTYDNGGCRDYAIDGRTALVSPRRDVGALARALDRLVADEALRARIARQGQAFIAAQFDWERATDRMEALFQGQREPRPSAEAASQRSEGS
jgi:glycosyltransferase involved in cell wall biosynthesis